MLFCCVVFVYLFIFISYFFFLFFFSFAIHEGTDDLTLKGPYVFTVSQTFFHTKQKSDYLFFFYMKNRDFFFLQILITTCFRLTVVTYNQSQAYLLWFTFF